VILGAVLASVTTWLQDLIDNAGEVAVGALIALETVVPPIPSEVVLPFAGFQAAQGNMNAVLAWVAATTGSLVGAWFLYGVGAWFGRERLGELAQKRWFIVLGPNDLDRGERFFAKHGSLIVLLGRCIPLVRSVVSIPAGIERMPLWRFTLFTAIGSAVWNAVFIYAGWQLEDQWDTVQDWIAPASYVVVALLVVAAIWLTLRKRAAIRSGADASS
jgi:membrane protein DedA with SNARE-associated domain